MTNWNEAKSAGSDEARFREAAADLREDAIATAGIIGDELVDLVSHIRERVTDLVRDRCATPVEHCDSLRRDG